VCHTANKRCAQLDRAHELSRSIFGLVRKAAHSPVEHEHYRHGYERDRREHDRQVDVRLLEARHLVAGTDRHAEEIVVQRFSGRENAASVGISGIAQHRCPWDGVRLTPTLFRSAQKDDALDGVGSQPGGERIQCPLLTPLQCCCGSADLFRLRRIPCAVAQAQNLGRECRLEVIYDNTRLICNIVQIVAEVLHTVIDEERRPEKQNQCDNHEHEWEPGPWRDMKVRVA
jgi:hypothetical protein